MAPTSRHYPPILLEHLGTRQGGKDIFILVDFDPTGFAFGLGLFVSFHYRAL